VGGPGGWIHITTDLESDLIEGMLCCDLVQINSIPNQNGTFLDLTFSKLVRTLRLRSTANRPFLDSIVKIRAYELLVDVRLCKFEATSMDERRFRFRAADYEAITYELGLVDWYGLFSRRGVDLCVDVYYDVIWSCFEKIVLKTSTRCG
jgi:hypothetical protein